MPDLALFYADLRNSVLSRATLDNQYTASAFLTEIGDRLVEAEEIENLTPVHFEGTGSRNRRLTISGFDLDDLDGSVVLVVSAYHDVDSPSAITSAAVTRAFGAVRAYLTDALSGRFQEGREESTPEWHLAENLRERGKKVTRYRLFFVTDAVAPERLKTPESEPLNGVPVDLHLWDLVRLHQVWESQQGREELEVDLTTWLPEGMPVLQAGEGSASFATYLACIPGDLVADLYGKFGSRLLESNVRSFLSARGKINRGIRATIANEPEMFLAFNNGITATATAVEKNELGNIVRIHNLQIVNGGQTTASLFYLRREQGARMSALTETAVQLKLVEVDAKRAQDLVPLISRYANSQNKVSEVDFFSNSPFHVRLEELSRRVLAPSLGSNRFQTKWFYERARGQYQNEVSKRSPGDAKKFQATYPKSQIITKTDAARFWNCWDQKPQVVSAGAQKNFVSFAATVQKEWVKSPDHFHEQYWRELVAKGILYRDLRQRISRADWYEQGYLANIVAYTIAKIASEVARSFAGRQFNLDAIWAAQSVDEKLLDLGVVVARAALMHLTADSRRLRNVTEWAKADDSWERFRKMPWPNDISNLEPHLLQAEVVRERRSRAASNQRLDTGIAAQAKAIELGHEFWSEIKEFGTRQRILSPTDQGILDVGSGRRMGAIPSEKQAARLLEIFARCEQLGFKYSS